MKVIGTVNLAAEAARSNLKQLDIRDLGGELTVVLINPIPKFQIGVLNIVLCLLLLCVKASC